MALLSILLFHGVDKFLRLGGFAKMTGLPIVIAFLVAAAEVGGAEGGGAEVGGAEGGGAEVGGAEVGGAVLIFIGGSLPGWLTRFGALMRVPVMLGAIFMVHWRQWHFMATETHPMSGMPFQVMILLFLLYLAIQGNQISAPNTASAPR